MSNAVTLVPAAPSELAIQHFESMLMFETDCWDMHEEMGSADPDFILLDVHSPELFAQGHIAGAINLPRRKLIASRMNNYPRDTLFVTYCAGPHCNCAARAAAQLARFSFPVKMMAGGVTGWLDEGFALVAEAVG